MAILTTNRLILRPLKRDDAPAMFKNWTWDERVARYCRWFPHENLSQTEDLLQIYLEQADNGFDYRWGIEREGELIGVIDVVESEGARASIGYVIGHEFWNKGYMSEALAAVMEHLFSCGFSLVTAEHHIDNPASGRVMEKCGMHFVGNRTGIRKFGSEETCILKCYRINAIGLKRHTLALVPYRPCWPILAKKEISRLKAALGSAAVSIEHVGSTAIGHIMSKPIIDIAVCSTDIPIAKERLLAAGAVCHGEEVKDEIFFTVGEEDIRNFHIHLCRYDSQVWQNYLNFRDYLMAYPDKAAEYEAYKIRAAKKFDRASYTANKTSLVTRLLQEAAQWR